MKLSSAVVLASVLSFADAQSMPVRPFLLLVQEISQTGDVGV